MLRRARAWASAELSRILHAEVDGARAELETSMDSRVAELASDVDRDAQQRDESIAASLDRLATALDAISAQLAAQSRDHRAGLAALEFVVREMALASMPPAPMGASTVVGGTIEPDTLDLTIGALAPVEVQPRDGMGPNGSTTTHDRNRARDELTPSSPRALDTDADSLELRVGCIVEVRSRFQNRWVDGFEIVEIVGGVGQAGAERYRLARHADHVWLPVLFDANDLRPLDVVSDIVIDPDVGVDVDLDDGPTVLSLEPDDPGSRR